jgi:elongation factor G
MLRDIPLVRLRNIGIIAHIDAGKTTCTERMLFFAGRIHRKGEVDRGDTELDYDPLERKMGITISSATTSFAWTPREAGDVRAERHRVSLVDTPGHVDFTVEVERSLRVLDGAVVLFDAATGVEPQSETVWRQADRYGVPRIAFVNKMDKVGASFASAVASIRDRLGARALPVQLPLGEEGAHRGVVDLCAMRAFAFEGGLPVEVPIPEDLVPHARRARAELCEACADFDDAILARMIDGGADDVGADALHRALRAATIAGSVVPVLCGSAHEDKGIQMLLDAVCAYLPSPLDVGPVRGHDPATGAELAFAPSEDAPLAALAFKVMSLDRVGSVTVLRVYSGCLRSGVAVLDTTAGVAARIGRLVVLHGDEATNVDAAPAGTIAAAIGLRLVRTGDTLADPSRPIVLAGLRIPEPVVELAVEPRSAADQEKLGRALARLAVEDPSFRVGVSPETGQTVLRGMGELHLAILMDRLRRDHGVDASTGRPHVAYRETIARAATAEHRLSKQKGGPGQFAHVVLAIAPAERGSGFTFTNETGPGEVPKELVPAVEQGVRGAMSRGVVSGHPMVDVGVRLVGGSFHPFDSKGPAFEVAASMAFRKAAEAADPHLLEPIMRVEVVTPEEHLGAVLADLQTRGGSVEDLGARAGACVVTALVPLRALFGHAGDLRSKTRGRAAATMALAHYARAPEGVAARLSDAPR